MPLQVSAEHLIGCCYMTRIHILLHFADVTAIGNMVAVCPVCSLEVHAARTHSYWTCVFLTDDYSTAFTQ